MSEEALPFEQPDPKVLKVWLISSLISYGVLALVVGLPLALIALADFANRYLLLLPVVPVLLWALTALFLKKTWKRWGFRVTPRTVEIKKGLIWRSYRVVARNRIQHIDINSGPMDRRFGLVQVVIYTAGTAVGMIPGLTPARAELLRTELSTSMETPKSAP